jgi:hypothetical protein
MCPRKSQPSSKSHTCPVGLLSEADVVVRYVIELSGILASHSENRATDQYGRRKTSNSDLQDV